MAGKIVIDMERCKACGLCIAICPNNCIKVSTESNQNGYFPALATNINCIACCRCATVCPDGVIEVFRVEGGDTRPVATEKKVTPHTVEENQ